MRKISKSINGSETHEDSVEKDTNGERESLADEAGNGDDVGVEPEPAEASDAENDNESTKPPKKRVKAQSKKKKQEKEEEEEEEYEVEKVIDSKKVKGKLQYLIRWKGYSADNDTWEPAKTLSCPELISKYEEEKKNAKPEKKTPKKSLKRKAGKKKDTPPAKKPKSKWDSEDADEDAEYEVDKILEVHHKKNGRREFLIHWKGWAAKFDSWEPENHLNCPELIKKFMDKVETAKSTDSRSLRVAPGSTKRFTLQAQGSGRRLSKRRGQKQRVRYDDAE